MEQKHPPSWAKKKKWQVRALRVASIAYSLTRTLLMRQAVSAGLSLQGNREPTANLASSLPYLSTWPCPLTTQRVPLPQAPELPQ